MQNMKSIRNVLPAALITAAAMSVAAVGASIASEVGETPLSQPAPPGSAERNHVGGLWHLLGKLPQPEFARLEAETRPQRLRGSSGAF